MKKNAFCRIMNLFLLLFIFGVTSHAATIRMDGCQMVTYGQTVATNFLLESTAVLRGTGTIHAVSTLRGMVSPGVGSNDAATLVLDAPTQLDGAQFTCYVAASDRVDRLLINGAVMGSATVLINRAGSAAPSALPIIVAATGSVFTAVTRTPTNGWRLGVVDHQTLDLTAVPEWMLLGTNQVGLVSSNTIQAGNGTDFGVARYGVDVYTNWFALTNNGTVALQISQIVTNGSSSLTVSPSTLTIPSETAMQIPVVFHPQAGGTQTTAFTFTHNGTESPFILNVGGLVRAGSMGFVSNQLHYAATYGDADPAAQIQQALNSGDADYTFALTDTASWLTIVPDTGSVAFSASQRLTNAVSLAGLNAGTYGATVTVTSAQCTNSPQTYAVTLEYAKAAQTISFPNPGAQITTNTTLLPSTSSRGLPLTYAIASGPAVLGYTTNTTYLTYTNAGTVRVTASQSGTINYLPAVTVTQTFAVTKAVASVSLTNLTQTYDRGVHTATVTCLPSVPYTVTYNGSASAPVNAGSYTVVATAVHPIWQGGATNTLTIQKSAQTVTFPGIDSQKTTNLVVLAASASSGYPVAFAVNYGPAVIGGFSNMTFTGAGMVSVGAVQAGNSNWLASGVTNTFMVSRADQTPLVFAPASPQIYDTTNQL
ncbi:MAG: DUF1573 domain-containing protein, partial [Spartobacteria bacterium]|nr:DUF1573 domain-containing protein [Spartobacteria bacterium]